jgi:hypothetical protein
MGVGIKWSSAISHVNSLDWLYVSVFADVKTQWRWEANFAQFTTTTFPSIKVIGGAVCAWAVNMFPFHSNIKKVLCPPCEWAPSAVVDLDPYFN